jgi:hypothetical protein
MEGERIASAKPGAGLGRPASVEVASGCAHWTESDEADARRIQRRGARGTGELGTTGVNVAVAAAIYDAVGVLVPRSAHSAAQDSGRPLVGWVERSETHPQWHLRKALMGVASLNPTSHIHRLVGWAERKRNPRSARFAGGFDRFRRRSTHPTGCPVDALTPHRHCRLNQIWPPSHQGSSAGRVPPSFCLLAGPCACCK